MEPLKLIRFPAPIAVCKFDPQQPPPAKLFEGKFFSVTRTPHEISAVIREADVQPEYETVERGWGAFVIPGPLAFDLVGILAEVSGVLAEAGIPIFALSTYLSDYILVKQDRLDEAEAALHAAGHIIIHDS